MTLEQAAREIEAITRKQGYRPTEIEAVIAQVVQGQTKRLREALGQIEAEVSDFEGELASDVRRIARRALAA